MVDLNLWHSLTPLASMYPTAERIKFHLKALLRTCQLWHILMQPCGVYTLMQLDPSLNLTTDSQLKQHSEPSLFDCYVLAGPIYNNFMGLLCQ